MNTEIKLQLLARHKMQEGDQKVDFAKLRQKLDSMINHVASRYLQRKVEQLDDLVKDLVQREMPKDDGVSDRTITEKESNLSQCDEFKPPP